MNEITLKEFAEIFKFIIENNRRLEDEGRHPISVAAEGACGLGKTTAIQELADEIGATFVKINLSELEEVSDLTGFPIKEYEVEVEGERKWVPADLVNMYTCDSNASFTGNSRMGYATPAWLPREDNEKGTILLIDDYTRKLY